LRPEKLTWLIELVVRKQQVAGPIPVPSSTRCPSIAKKAIDGLFYISPEPVEWAPFFLFSGPLFMVVKSLKTLSRADFRSLRPKIFSGGGFFCLDGQGWFWDVKKCRKWL
jgi:hypothetical protein